MSSTTSAAPECISRPAATPTAERGPAPRVRRRTEPIFYLFLVPTLAVFTLAIILPALIGFGYSFTNSIGFGEFEFIGLANYAAAFGDPAILDSYGFTLGFALVTVIAVNLIAFPLAVGLTARIRLRTALRAVFVIPMVVSGLIIAYVFQFLFSNSLPALGQAIGFEPLATSILANPELAWLSIVFVTAWQAIPSTMLIYMAGLLAIPGEVYEAGALDGANAWQRLSRITIPLVSGYIVINTIIGFKNFLNAYDTIVALTGGGPGVATRSVAMTIFSGFSGGDYAYQMANATLFFLIAIALAVLQLRITRGKAALTR